LLAEIAQGAAANLKRCTPGFHPLEIEDVINQTDKAVGIGGGDTKKVHGPGLKAADGSGGQQTKRSSNAGQGSSQLMGDGGDKFILQLIELGTLGELYFVLVLLFAGLSKLFGKFPRSPPFAKKGEQQDPTRH
jgi:hypothetical protein